MADIVRYTPPPPRGRVVGLSKLGKVAAGAALVGAGTLAYRKRKAIKRGFQKTRRAFNDFRYGSRRPLMGPLLYETRREHDRVRKAGTGEEVRVPARTAARALKYGLGGVVAGEVAGTIGGSILTSMRRARTVWEAAPAFLAGHAAGRAGAYGATTALYAHVRRKERAAERRAARRGKAAKGAATAG